jgi:hypothetical protein
MVDKSRCRLDDWDGIGFVQYWERVVRAVVGRSGWLVDVGDGQVGSGRAEAERD